jgi:hypothetical protein
MVEAILDGRQPKGMTLPALLEPFPVEWMQQTGCRLRLSGVSAYGTKLAN